MNKSSVFQKELPTSDVLITTPFHPGYLTRELIAKADKLKLAVTAGVGSDHIDLNAANERKITVAEVTGSNVVSVYVSYFRVIFSLFYKSSSTNQRWCTDFTSHHYFTFRNPLMNSAEHVVMSILLLVRNFVPAHEMIERGNWAVSDVARNTFDLEGKVIGTIGAGRIGYRVLQRLVAFDPKELLYYDYAPLPADAAKAVNARKVDNLKVRHNFYPQPSPLRPKLDHCNVHRCFAVIRNSLLNVTSSRSTVPSMKVHATLSTRKPSNGSNRGRGWSIRLVGPFVMPKLSKKLSRVGS